MISLAIIAAALVLAAPVIIAVGHAFRSVSLGARPLAAAEVMGRPGGEVVVPSRTAPRRGEPDENNWRDLLFEYAAHPCRFAAEGEGQPCALVPALDREIWCVECLSGAALGLPVLSLPPTTSVPVPAPGAEVAPPAVSPDADAAGDASQRP